MNNNEDFYKSKVHELAELLQQKRLAQRGIVLQTEEPIYVIYARRSTKAPKKGKEDKEDKQERSVDDQINTCKEFAAKNDLKWVAIEREEETAHKSDKRDVFYKVLDNIRNRRGYNSILAWHPDRLARNMKDSGEIIDMLDSGTIIDLKFPAFTFVNDPSGKMALGIQFVLAKNYSDGLSVTTGRGIEETTKEGKYMGKTKHGYIAKAKGFYQKDNATFHKVQSIWQEALKGKPAKELSEFAKSIGYPMQSKAILNMLHEPFYAGFYVHGGIITDLSIKDPDFTPMITYKEFIEIDRQIADRKSFEYSEKVENILFKKMVQCMHCNRMMSAYKSPNRYQTLYYYVGCTNKDCAGIKDKKKRIIRGKVITNYMLDLFESKLNVTKEAYNDSAKKFKETKASQLETIKSQIASLNYQIANLEDTVKGLSKSLGRAKSQRSEDELSSQIADASEQMNEQKEQRQKLEDELIKLESRVNETVMSYEDFLNFFKKARQIVKSNKDTYLLDQLVRNVFLNFFVEDGNVIGHRLKEPFATYELMGSDIMGG